MLQVNASMLAQITLFAELILTANTLLHRYKKLCAFFWTIMGLISI